MMHYVVCEVTEMQFPKQLDTGTAKPNVPGPIEDEETELFYELLAEQRY